MAANTFVKQTGFSVSTVGEEHTSSLRACRLPYKEDHDVSTLGALCPVWPFSTSVDASACKLNSKVELLLRAFLGSCVQFSGLGSVAG